MALRDFISVIQNSDVARTNRFLVEIQPPETLGLKPQRQINLLCQDVNFPGQNIRTSTDDLRQGPTREIGQAVTYGDITMTFICTSGLPEKMFFEAWQKLMFNSVTWQAKYYKSYIGEIKLKELDRADRVRYGIILYEAYPKIINAQDYSNTASDTIQTLQIQFVYHHWTSDGVDYTPVQNYDVYNTGPVAEIEKKEKVDWAFSDDVGKITPKPKRQGTGRNVGRTVGEGPLRLGYKEVSIPMKPPEGGWDAWLKKI